MARILIIDDDEAIRELMRHLLRPLGHEITEAANGREGFRRATRDDFDLVICDLRMPDWDGIDSIGTIHIVKPDVRVLVVSAFLEDAARRSLEEYGSVMAAIDKPFDVGEFVLLVERLAAM